jgi:hypothetical protein
MLGGFLLLVAVVGAARDGFGSRGESNSGLVVTSDSQGQRTNSEPGRVLPAQPPSPPQKPAATLTMPSKAATQWEEFTFSAEGFKPGEKVSVQVDQGGTLKELGQVDADSDGKITDGKIQLPYWLESGNRSVQVVGVDSGTQATGTLHIRAKQLWINLSGYTPQPATTLGFIAGGFEPGDKVKVYLTQNGAVPTDPSVQPVATATADEAGNTVWTEFQVPVVEPGKYTLLLQGDSTKDPAKASIDVTPLQPQMELSPWSGLPGSSFDVNAKGFLANEDVDLYLGESGTPLSTYQADEYGGVWGAGPISVPTQSKGGAITVTLRGKQSGSVVKADFNVVPANPWLELSNYSGFAGSPVMAKGGGFAAGERVTLHIGNAGGPSVGETVAAEDGSYQGIGPVYTPSDATQEVTFVAVGESSGTQATATYKVVEPFNQESPGAPGAPGAPRPRSATPQPPQP